VAIEGEILGVGHVKRGALEERQEVWKKFGEKKTGRKDFGKKRGIIFAAERILQEL